MSTRAYIARETRQGSGQYQTIFNHSNGDPDSLGRILKRNFSKKAAIDELMNGGDIEYIHPASGKILRDAKHPFYRLIQDAQLHNMRYTHQIDFLYVYERGRWTAYNLRDEEIELV